MGAPSSNKDFAPFGYSSLFTGLLPASEAADKNDLCLIDIGLRVDKKIKGAV